MRYNMYGKRCSDWILEWMWTSKKREKTERANFEGLNISHIFLLFRTVQEKGKKLCKNETHIYLFSSDWNTWKVDQCAVHS